MIMPRVRSIVAVLAAASAAVFYVAVGSNIVGSARKHDFLNLYTGATLAHNGEFARLHDGGRQFEIERSLLPDLPALVPFVRPPIYAGVLSPIARMPIQRAFWVWIGLQSLILAVCWAWAARRFGPSGLIWSSLFLPTSYGIANGQDCVIMLALMIVAFELAGRDRPWASGFTIGLALIKFHLLLLFPLLMLLNKRWRMFAGYCAAAAIEVAASLLLGGWSGMLDYARLLQRKDIDQLSPSPEMMSNIYAIPANLGIDSAIVSPVLAAIVLGLTLVAAWHAPLRVWFSAAIAGSLLIAPHVYGYDAAMLLPPVLLAIFLARTKMLRYAAMVLALPCVFWLPAAPAPWAMGPGVAILVLLLSLARERMSESASEVSETSAPNAAPVPVG